MTEDIHCQRVRPGGPVQVGEIVFGAREFHLIAGPCAVESREQMLTVAEGVAAAGAVMLRGGAYKPRTSPFSFQGLKETGLDLLLDAGEVVGLPVVTEVVSVAHVEQIAAYVDVLQVGARNMQNFELLRKLGQTGKPVLLKRGLAATVDEWLAAAQYIAAEGNEQIILCERGIRTYESATRFTLDLSAVALAKSMTGYPVLVDPSHGTGRAELVLPMAKAAAAVGADGLMVEVHQQPETALCDGAQSLSIADFRALVEALEPYLQAAGKVRKRLKKTAAARQARLSPGQEVKPSLDVFCKKAAAGEKVVPLYCEIMLDRETPAAAFEALGRTPYSFILESVEGSEQIARYSFVSNDPYLIFQAKGDRVSLGTVEDAERYPGEVSSWQEIAAADPMQELRSLLEQYSAAPDNDLPRFFGGAVGFIGFEGMQYFEPVLKESFCTTNNLPDLSFMFTRSLLVFDHLKGTLKVIVNALPGEDPEAEYKRSVQLIRSILTRLRRPVRTRTVTYQGVNDMEQPVDSNFSREQFCAAVEQARHYINEGDIFQVVLSQRFTLEADFDPVMLLRCLKAVNPSPYMFYVSFNDIGLVGASPEMLVRLENGEVQLRPIAGTRRRGKDPQDDKQLAGELQQDEKEQAEHVMLVDLGRNDLGRVCRFGSISVEEFAQVEYFSHVMHLVSRVKGELLPDKTALDVLAAAFPAGTVSGAPKIRAVEIINELESEGRELYAGLVGYISYDGQMDTCINIRSVQLCGGKAFVQSGAGIVYDSQPEQEYVETLNKAGAMFQAIKMARGGA